MALFAFFSSVMSASLFWMARMHGWRPRRHVERLGGNETRRPPVVTDKATSLTWAGEVPAQKWMNLYT